MNYSIKFYHKVIFSILIFISLIIAGCGNECDNERCLLDPDPGPCNAAFIKYYYEEQTGKCVEFTWGGCEGVVPFETLDDCLASCECKE